MTSAAEPRIWMLDIGPLSYPERAQQWRTLGLVSDAELTQATRFRHSGARMQFLAGRALVRHALAHAARCAPQQVHIVAGASGKPALASPLGALDWHFNLSHSGTLVACAVAAGPIGIDVEAVRHTDDYAAIAHAHFSPAEACWVGARADAVARRFVALWTVKEAYLKALGIGLAIPLAGIAAQRSGLRAWRVASQAAADSGAWHCRLARPAPGYWLAVCYENALAPLRVEWASAPPFG